MKNLEITQVKNGYMVKHYSLVPDEISVFKTKKEMLKFINKYFLEKEVSND